MKKVIVLIIIALAVLFLGTNIVKADTYNDVVNDVTTSKMVELSETEKTKLDDYIEAYGSDTYGFTAYVLNKIQIYSIPFCFLGIAVSGIYQYVIGIRKLDIRYKGFYTMIAFITVFVICQVLPLVFVIVIKGFGGN